MTSTYSGAPARTVAIPRDLAAHIHDIDGGIAAEFPGPTYRKALDFAETHAGLPTFLPESGRVIFWRNVPGLRVEPVVDLRPTLKTDLRGLPARLRALGMNPAEVFRGDGLQHVQRFARRRGDESALVIVGGVDAGLLGETIARWALFRRTCFDASALPTSAPVSVCTGGLVSRVGWGPPSPGMKAQAMAGAHGEYRVVFLVPPGAVPSWLAEKLGTSALVVELADESLRRARLMHRPILVIGSEPHHLGGALGAAAAALGIYRDNSGRPVEVSPPCRRRLTGKGLELLAKAHYRFVDAHGAESCPPRSMFTAVVRSEAFVSRLNPVPSFLCL